MTLILRKSEWLDDWYVIERAEHDGTEWLEPVEGGFTYQRSSRLGNADIEGTAAEMLAIAEAIEQGQSISFCRCAARYTANGYLLGSPRNSTEFTLVPEDDARELASTIRSCRLTVVGL